MTQADEKAVIGHAPEELSLALRDRLAGYWAALELYDPHRLPLRKIAVIAGTPATCFALLVEKGLDPNLFEIVRLHAAF